MRGWRWAVICILWIACQSAAGREPCPCSTSPYLRACGAKLYLGNTEFRTVGFNAYQIFRWYAGIDPSPVPGASAHEHAKQVMRDISVDGSFLLRVAGPMYAQELRRSFFDDDPARQVEKREAFHAAMLAMLDDAAAGGHRVVYSLAWDLRGFAELGGHSLRVLVTDPASRGRKMLYEYVDNVTSRHSRDPRIAFWETDNEADLFAGRAQQHFELHELATFYEDLIARIRSVDKYHLVSTGASEEAVWHMDKESPDAHADHMKEEQAAADLISVHFYYNSSLPLKWYARTAKKLGKPLYIGELGVAFERDAKTNEVLEAEYRSKDSLKDFERKVRDVSRYKIPIALWWNLNGMPDGTFDLHRERTPEAFRTIVEANRKARKGKRLRCPE